MLGWGLPSPILQMGNRSTERLSDLPKVTEYYKYLLNAFVCVCQAFVFGIEEPAVKNYVVPALKECTV